MKKYKPLRYNGVAVVFSEVPDEVSLAISITGCPRRCPGCHSEYLWEYSGNLLFQDLDALIRRYIGMITCVCFMGGDAENPKELKKCLKRVKRYGLKTALYSGASYTIEKKYISSIDVSVHSPLNPLLRYLDYLKIGPYEKDHGGLDDLNTNQRMIERDPSSKNNWTDITYKFQKKDNLTSLTSTNI